MKFLLRSGFLATACLLMIPALGLSSDQNLYFHLHQACEFFEALKKGKCPSASERVRFHLNEAAIAIEKSRAFKAEFQTLQRLYQDRERAQFSEIEELLSRVQRQAEALQLEHKKLWHEEIRLCPRFN